jgi:2,4-dienoyl-CoA reductase-like NADH-dependent reductase (Old Yellow Enzyme family)
MAQLFTPFKLRNIELKNRIVVSPMCQYSSVDGFANDWHLVHLGSRAVGGAGLVLTEATAVAPEGRITSADLGIWKDEHIEFLRRIVTFISRNGAVPGMQLAHAGRKASVTEPWNGGTPVHSEDGGWQTLAPSAVPFTNQSLVPRAMSIQEINKLISDFRAAAARALTAGFQVLEIHAAHGYLINEFMSPLSNSRTDEYGGSFENRTRLLLQVIRAVRDVWPAEFPLFVRISASDWTEGGWTLDDSVALAGILQQQEVDLIDCSSGGVVLANIPAAPGYQVPFAETIRKETGMPTGAVGIIISASQAEEVVSGGKADLVIMARELLRDPYFPLRAAAELGEEVIWPVQYERAKRKK